MGFETRNLIFRVTMAAFVSVVAIFVIHVAAAYPQEAEIIAQDSASGGYENAVSNEAAQLRDHQQAQALFSKWVEQPTEVKSGCDGPN